MFSANGDLHRASRKHAKGTSTDPRMRKRHWRRTAAREHGSPRARRRRTTADAGESMPVTHRSDWPVRPEAAAVSTAGGADRANKHASTSSFEDFGAGRGPRSLGLSERPRRTRARWLNLPERVHRLTPGQAICPSGPVGPTLRWPVCPNALVGHTPASQFVRIPPWDARPTIHSVRTPPAAPATCQPIMTERAHALAPDRQRAILAAEHTDGCPCRSSTA
jgi:hypothetical protein